LLKIVISGVILISLLISMQPTQASPSFNITIETSKLRYLIEETIEVYGNLTYNGWPVQRTAIALKVVDPDDNPVFVRALETDTYGTYNITFRLPPAARLGIYTVYVSAHVEEPVTDNTTFGLVMLGDVNGDGKVDLKDVYSVGEAYGSFPGHPKWRPGCDINCDLRVDLKDYYLVIINYGKVYP
jgi:hypothetical protein